MALKKTILEPSWEAKYSFSPAVITEGGQTIWLSLGQNGVWRQRAYKRQAAFAFEHLAIHREEAPEIGGPSR